ncbi:hypothetical protein OPT61_g4508 [Boeremia exigua]|uniref:Uncharacterized protein n=1 Tax=Boeremia exigua TaxID=749465 RepID=A0ACC2IDR6_9PLEO|nr:hypothetical protein OPT61_g4508 [Boeremia exigua]
MQVQDYLIYTAYIFFLTMSICYLVIVPTIYRVGRVSNGLEPPWATIAEDAAVYKRLMFITTTLFWLSLWLVKFSLLALYKRLVVGLPFVYVRMWWAVFVFCLISLVGCIVSYLTSCEDFVDSLRVGGQFSGPRTVRGQLASLYMSYAVDVISDFLIMLLPIRVVWKLQVPRGQKIAIVALFSSGLVCIAFATLRLIQVGRQSGDTYSPNPTWLSLWTVIEGSVAICIGCGPAFVVFYQAARNTNASSNTDGYHRYTHSRSENSQLRPDVIRMNTVSVGTGRARDSRKDPYWDDNRSSQEALAADDKGIMVTTTLHQNHESDRARRNSLST